MIQLRLYLYDSAQETLGYRGTELTEYLLLGGQNTEDITQVVDVSEVTLMGYPSPVAFAPETMMIIDEEEDGVTVRSFHRVVKDDAVTQPRLSDNTYFEHAITLTEPSIIAQKRLVDNMAITYKLKDVKLDTQTGYDTKTESGWKIVGTSGSPSGKTAGYWSSGTTYGGYAFKRFHWTGYPKILSSNGTNQGELKYHNISEFNPDESGVGTAKFKLPYLYVQGLRKDSSNIVAVFPVSISYTIEEQEIGKQESRVVGSGVITSKSDLSSIGCSINNEWLLEDISADSSTSDVFYRRYRRYTDTSITSDISYETVSFEVKADFQYTLTCRLASLDGELNSSALNKKYTGTTIAEGIDYTVKYDALTRTNELTKSRTPSLVDTYTQSAVFVMYSTESQKTVLASGNPYSCENLIKKAVLNSMLKPRQVGAAVGQLSYVDADSKLAYDCPFYIDPAFEQQLALTQVVETFFNQKNLWEVLIEAGHYIHSIPELVFGGNNKLMLTFNELGSTDEKLEKGTRMSVTNFQGVDDYICEINSYITNYVQLGGQITEWVAAKTTDDTYLVSNDTAELVVSFPIIELLDVTIKANATYKVRDNTVITAGTTADATTFFYEKNVYQLLSIIYTDVPNKGIAMYYSLGDNKIIGGDYQLPQANANLWSDYAIKKIIYCAFNGYDASLTASPWQNIKVNDFSFRITYRTKSSVRQSHTRPDVRKFLVNSKFDETPQHRQIANQTETVVDSQKYGSNMYGTLLKTGNNEYENECWFSSVYDLPRKGDLTRIDGEIYYVAKVMNVYYPNHIESKVTYSKDYNELSKIIGIPSEPRFYEISEQSTIDRHVSIDDYLLVTTDTANFSPNNADGYLEDVSHLKKLVLGGVADFAKYAVTAFKGDADVGVDSGTFGEEFLYIEVMSPLNAYSAGNTLTYSWAMADNFSAGDKVGDIEYTSDKSIVADNAYRALSAVKYTDKYGKAALFDFFILEDYTDFTDDKINALPESPVTAKGDNPSIANTKILASNVDVNNTDYNRRGLILLKDCRERLIFNYNLRYITDSDRFVSSPFFFSPKDNTVKVALLSNEVNKLSSGYFSTGEVMAVIDVPSSAITETSGTDVYGQTKPIAFSLKMSELISDSYFTEDGVPTFKAIALITAYNSQVYSTQFTLARNIDTTMTKAEARADWNFGVPKNAFFTNRQ